MLTAGTLNLWAQKAIYVYRDYDDSTMNCYLKIMPDNQPIKGLIIRDFTRLPNTVVKSPYKFTDLAVASGLMVLYTCTSNFFPELGYTEAPSILLDEIANEVIIAHNIPKDNIFIGGISASGTRALQYTRFCEQGKSKYGTKIKAVFSVDSPLDFERFYNSCVNNGSNFTDGMAWEAEHIPPIFKARLGTPKNNPDSYLQRSIYSQFADKGGNAIYFKNVPMILFHEPDMDWWSKERGVSYFDINSFDIAGFVNQLEKLGNKDLTLVTTSGKGFDRKGNRKCHSWSIVDEQFLLDWILARLE